MRKLFKKSLACCLALALCFSLFAGAISANALTTNPAYSTEDVTVAPGESTTIKFTIKDFAEIQGVILKVYVPSVVASIDAVTVDGIELVEWSDETGEGNYQVDNENKFIKFMTLANFEGVDNVAALTFDIKVTVDAKAEAGEYGYTAPVIQATDGDSLVTINGEFGKFTVVEKEPEVPVCQHAWELVSAEAATDADHPGHLNFVCSKCGEEENNEVTYHGKFRFNAPSIELKSEILIKVGNSKDRYNSVPSGAASGIEKGVMVFTNAEGEIISTNDLVNERTEVGSSYIFPIKVAAYDLLEEYGATSYAYCDGKWYSGKTAVNSVAGLITSNFDSLTTEEKTLYVDLLNFGAEVQTNFNIKTDALANSTLTSEQAAFATTTKPELPAYELPASDNTTDVFTVRWGFESESKVILKYVFNPKNYKAKHGDSVETLKPVVSYTDSWGTAYTGDNAFEYAFNGDLNNTVLNYDEKVFSRVEGKNNQFNLAFNEFTICDIRTPMTISFFDGEGNPVETTVTASLENLVSAAYASSNAADQALYDALFRYCDSARAVFVK